MSDAKIFVWTIPVKDRTVADWQKNCSMCSFWWKDETD